MEGIGIYAPTDDSLVEVKDEFYETLTGLIERVGHVRRLFCWAISMHGQEVE